MKSNDGSGGDKREVPSTVSVYAIFADHHNSDMKILIIGGGLFNRGGTAMMRTVISQLGERLPGADFFIGTHHVRQIGGKDVVAAGIPQIQVQKKSKPVRIAQLLKSALQLPGGPGYWRKREGDISYQQAVVEEVDAFVDISGFLYVDKRGPSSALKLASLTLMAEAKGVPYIYLPQTFGPFTIRKLRKGTEKAARASSLLYTRDALSRQYVADLLGKPLSEVKQSPDIAFLYKGDAPSPDRMRALDLDPDRPILGISPNVRVYEHSTGKGSENKYLCALTRAIKHFTDLGVQVLLLPHEMWEKEGTIDDSTLCAMLLRNVDPELVRNVGGSPSAEELKSLIGGCDMLVGSRFHSLVAALSQGIPAVAVGWAHKYPELLREFGLEDYVYDYDSVSDSDFARVVGEAWDERVELKNRVDAALPGVKKRLNEVFNEVAVTIQEAAAARKRPGKAA